MTPNRPWRRVRRVAPTSSITGMRFRYPMNTRIGLAAQAEIATFLCTQFMYRVIHLFSRSRTSLSTGVWTKSVEDIGPTARADGWAQAVAVPTAPPDVPKPQTNQLC